MPERADDDADLATWLGAEFERCARKHPDFAKHLASFADSLGARFAAPGDRSSIPSHAVEDLFVAWAALEGVPEALEHLERAYVTPSCAAVRSADATELAQVIRVRLLVRDGERPPKLSQYTGRGPLLAWVRMTATRIAIDLSRKAGTESRVTEELAHASTPFDPELDYLKARYAEPFRNALEQALRALSERDRALVKLAYLDDVPISAMARMYGVSARTVQRWIADARAAVLEGARRSLSETLDVAPSEIDGLLRLAQSQLKVTLERILGAPGKAQT
jgi:RNA polymerase sigma-70 factor (ECF subfamily)